MLFGVGNGDVDGSNGRTGSTVLCGKDVPNADGIGTMAVGLDVVIRGKEEVACCGSNAGIAGRARSGVLIAGVKALEDIPPVGPFCLLRTRAGEASIEARLGTIMVVEGPRGEVGRFVLEAGESAEGWATGDDWAIASLTLGELV